MLEYLAVIEKKTNDILQLYYLLQNKSVQSITDKTNETLAAGSMQIRDPQEQSNQLRDLLTSVEIEAANERDPNAPMQAHELEKFADDKIGKFSKERRKVRQKTHKLP